MATPWEGISDASRDRLLLALRREVKHDTERNIPTDKHDTFYKEARLTGWLNVLDPQSPHCAPDAATAAEAFDQAIECVREFAERPTPVDTTNFCLVAAQDNRIRIMLHERTKDMTHDQALVLAATIVAMVADEKRWSEVLEAVRNA